ncbi:MAG TPA: hypothetical protein VFW09_14380 [Solirubrobacteraceae bacterium]|nr:hypothetical protein [Solirubrobacteraceae bacterium]
MSPVTTQRRPGRRTDGNRRPGTTRCAAQPATLFDAPPTGARASERDRSIAHVDGLESTRVSAAVADPTRSGEPHREAGAAGHGETLDRLVVGGWERLTSRATTACLLCGGTMEPVYGAHARPIGGRCRDCGTTLA